MNTDVISVLRYSLTLSLVDWTKLPLCYFTLSNARRFYTSRESPWMGKDEGCTFEHFPRILRIKLFNLLEGPSVSAKRYVICDDFETSLNYAKLKLA